MKFFILIIFLINSFTNCYNCPKYTKNLVIKNYKLVPYFAKDLIYNRKLNYEQKNEMIQEGYIGLIYACRKFNESKGLKISTYSRWWILAYMNAYLNKYYHRNKNLVYLNELNTRESYHYNVIPELNMNILTPFEKKLIYQRFFQNLSISTIAKQQKVHRNTITYRINKILKKIRIINKIE